MKRLPYWLTLSTFFLAGFALPAFIHPPQQPVTYLWFEAYADTWHLPKWTCSTTQTADGNELCKIADDDPCDTSGGGGGGGGGGGDGYEGWPSCQIVPTWCWLCMQDGGAVYYVDEPHRDATSTSPAFSGEITLGEDGKVRSVEVYNHGFLQTATLSSLHPEPAAFSAQFSNLWDNVNNTGYLHLEGAVDPTTGGGTWTWGHPGPGDTTSGTWWVTNIRSDGETIEEPVIAEPLEEPPVEEPSPVEVPEEVEDVDLLTRDPELAALSTEEQAALVGAAVLGAVVGTAAVQAGAGLLRRAVPPALVPSPVDGKPVSAKQAAFEQEKLRQGYRYNPVSDGFDYVPEAERTFVAGPSIMAGQMAQVHADADKRRAAIQLKVQASRQKYADSVRAEMDRHQQSFQQHMQTAERYDRYSTVAGAVGTAADIAVDALAECTGPAGKTVKLVYDRAKDVIQYGNDVYDHGIGAGTAKFVGNKAYETARNKMLQRAPMPKFGSGKGQARYFGVGPNTLAREVTPRVVDALGNSAAGKGAEQLVDAGKDALLETEQGKKVIRKINTALGGR